MTAYFVHLFIYFCVYATVGCGLTVVVGYTGFFTLAQAGFFAIGCYCYALGATAWEMGLATILLLAIGTSALVSLILSLGAWRLKGDFFIMWSLAVQTLIASLLNNSYQDGSPTGSWRNLSNGPSGIIGIPRPVIIGIKFETDGLIAILALSLLCATLLYLRALLASPWGSVVLAMRDDELAARGLGKKTKELKVHVFFISSVLAALAGVLFAAYAGYIDPMQASIDQSVLMLSMVIVGGLGSLRGAVLGAGLLILIPELLRFANLPQSSASSLRLMAYGLLLVIMMHGRPQGIWGRFGVK